MSVTISDVAKEAGVSTSTVSKVLNGWTTISDATCNRIHEAIRKLNYTPNARAVSFARQSTRNIVFLTALSKNEAYKNPHMFDIMCGVNSVLTAHDYTMTLVDTSLEASPGEIASRIVATRSADGMVVHGSAVSRELDTLINKESFPHIVIGVPGFDSQLCWIDTNHALAGRVAAEYLINCGYTRVAFVGGRNTDFISMQRQKGFLGSMADFRCIIPAEMICYTDSSKEEAYTGALKLLSLTPAPQAIVCENNTIAIGVAKAINEKKLMPSDIGLITFDLYPYSQMLEPVPTVVDINVYDMGVQAGNIILRKLENPSLQIQSYTTLPMIIPGETTPRL